MADRISSLDDGYEPGDLSTYPEAIDTEDTLYKAKNNAATELTHALSYNGAFVSVNDTSAFADNGLLRIGEELIYYGSKSGTVFKDLHRGFAGSRQNQWQIGTKVTSGVMAEHHNAIKDAIHNIQEFIGTSLNPDPASFNGKLVALERKLLSPTPLFRAFPRTGKAPLTVRFQNFSNKEAVRFLWDFGDGSTSTERNPFHTYVTDGDFTIQLRMITSLNGNGIITKAGYIKVQSDKGEGFMYVTPEMGTTATTFTFVDQTDGDIIQRYWNFGDGNKETISDPDIHSISHTYSTAGSYNPNLLVVFSDQTLKQVTLTNPIVITS